jgi:hypothetical protein
MIDYFFIAYLHVHADEPGWVIGVGIAVVIILVVIAVAVGAISVILIKR